MDDHQFDKKLLVIHHHEIWYGWFTIWIYHDDCKNANHKKMLPKPWQPCWTSKDLKKKSWCSITYVWWPFQMKRIPTILSRQFYLVRGLCGKFLQRTCGYFLICKDRYRFQDAAWSILKAVGWRCVPRWSKHGHEVVFVVSVSLFLLLVASCWDLWQLIQGVRVPFDSFKSISNASCCCVFWHQCFKPTLRSSISVNMAMGQY